MRFSSKFAILLPQDDAAAGGEDDFGFHREPHEVLAFEIAESTFAALGEDGAIDCRGAASSSTSASRNRQPSFAATSGPTVLLPLPR